MSPAPVARGGRFDPRPVRRFTGNDLAPAVSQSWPASIPAVHEVLRNGVELPSGVTFLVGENGSGKSTLLEGLAGAFGLGLEGGMVDDLHRTHASKSDLHRWLQLTRGAGASHRGFFLRAETMHAYYTYLADLGASAGRASTFHEMSHGESFLDILERHLRRPGLYCLDEPEAALSFTSTLTLIGLLHDLTSIEGTQVVCATHSPVLAALPGATIFELGDWGLRRSNWDDLVLVANWRSYLEDPNRYLRHVTQG